jgi:hypothetical protein
LNRRGIREYWIIGRFRRALTALRGAREDHIVGEGQSYATALLPGFELVLGRLLAVADRCCAALEGRTVAVGVFKAQQRFE